MTVDRRLLALISLKHRLTLELRIAPFAKGRNGRESMRAVKSWLPEYNIKNRKQGLDAVLKELAKYPVPQEAPTTNPS